MKDDIKKYLVSLSDEKYLELARKLNVKTKYQLLGVRIPLLRDYAKKLSKKYELDYLLNEIDDNYFEEIILKGILIGLYKNISFNEFVRYLEYYVPKIDDWAICDTFCSSLKITKKYRKDLWKIIKNYLKSRKEFEVRFALVMILNYYLDEDYFDEIYNLLDKIKCDDYYVKMAVAWLMSYLIIFDYQRALNYLKKDTLDNWTINKSITKSIESFRVSDDHKEELRELRRRNE